MLRLALRPASARCRVRLLSSGRTSGPGVPGGRGVQGPAGPNVRSGGSSGGGGSGGGGSSSGGSGSGGGKSGSGGHAAGVADSEAAGHWGFSSPRASAASADHVRHVVSERLHVLSDTISASVSQQQREEMERLFKQTLNERSRAVAAALCGALIVFGGIAFTNRQRAREIVVEELSQAASGTLGDEKMQMQATALTLQTLRALLQDEVTQQRSVGFVAALAEHPTTRAALLSLLVSALKDEAVLKEALQLTLWVLGRDDTRDVVITALIAALTSEAFLEAAGEFAVRWLERPEVREAVSEVLQSSSMAVLDNEEVRGEARQLVQALLEQPHLQAKTGEHLWAAMKGGIFGLGYKKSTEPVPAAAAHPEVAAATEKLSKPPPLAPPGEAEAEGSAGARAAGEAGAPLEGDAPLMRELQLVRHASEARQASARRSEGET